MSVLKFAVIGTSWWADMWHISAVKSIEGSVLQAICGRNRARAEELAAKYKIPEVYTDYKKMIDSEYLDAVLVLTPDDQHYPMTMYALQRDMHVLCEKPLAVSVSQAKEMYETAADRGVKTMIYFTNRWVPVRRQVKRLIDAGYVGRFQHCDISYVAGYGIGGHYAWRFDADRGLGILGDLGSHTVDLARWYFGDIARVSAHLKAAVSRKREDGTSFNQANDCANILLEFAEGGTGSVQVSAVRNLADEGQTVRTTLYGEKGTIDVLTTMSGKYLMRGAQKDAESFENISIDSDLLEGIEEDPWSFDGAKSVFQKQQTGVRQFADAIRHDRPTEPSFFDGLQCQRVLEAAIRSHEEGLWVTP